MIFTLASGLLLALTNMVTKGPIEAQQQAKADEARKKVLPLADTFEAYETDAMANYSDLDSVYVAKSGGETVGYALKMSPFGYKADIVMTLGVNADGSVNALSINSQSETAGLGTRVAEEPFLSQFPGIAADPDAVTGEVDTITGATVSSKAVRGAIVQATTFLRDELGIKGQANAAVGQAESEGDKALKDQLGAKTVSELNPFAALGYDAIEGIYTASFGDENAYVFKLKVVSRADILMTLTIGESGAIRSFSVESQQEGEGYGSRIQEDAFMNQFAGVPANDGIDESIDGLTGATNTYNTVMKGIHQAIDYYQTYLKTGGTAK